MRIYTLKTQMVTPVSVRDAFEVFEDPRNLARITPPWLDFRMLTRNPVMQQGAELEYRFKWLGCPLRWKTRITEYEPPFYFIDEEARGPYTLWRHTHTFHPTEDGTLVTDEVDHALPFGALGRLCHALLVGEQLKAIFRYRQAALNEMICQGRGRWTEPSITPKQPQSAPRETANRGTHTHVGS